MAYVPAFTEIFLGFVICVVWSTWLQRRRISTTLTFWIPFGVGAVILLGQLSATYAIVSAQSGAPADEGFVELGRWGSFGAVLIALVMLGALTATGRPEAPDAPPAPPAS